MKEMKKILALALAAAGAGNIAEASNKPTDPQDVELKSSGSSADSRKIKTEERDIGSMEEAIKIEEITNNAYIESRAADSQKTAEDSRQDSQDDDYVLQADMSSILTETAVSMQEKADEAQKDSARAEANAYAVAEAESPRTTAKTTVITAITPVYTPPVKAKSRKAVENRKNLEKNADSVKQYFAELTKSTKQTVDKVLKSDVIEVTENSFTEDRLSENALLQNIEEIAADSKALAVSGNLNPNEAEILVKLNKSLNSAVNRINGKIIEEDIRVVSSGIDRLRIKIAEKSLKPEARKAFSGESDSDGEVIEFESIVVEDVMDDMDTLEKPENSDRDSRIMTAELKTEDFRTDNSAMRNLRKANLEAVSAFDLGEEIKRLSTTKFFKVNDSGTENNLVYSAVPEINIKNTGIMETKYLISEDSSAAMSEVEILKSKISLLENQKDFSNKDLREQLQAQILKNRENEVLIWELRQQISELKKNSR